jgi:hypothetical protein
MRTEGVSPGYWDRRRHLSYYREVVRLARKHVPGGGEVIDVGAHETKLVEHLDWFERRVALDVRYVPPRRAVETVVADFEDYEPESRFDLVLCLQVLEHLERPAPFARKLLETGHTVIVTVPYRWPAGRCETHLQDPVDERKLRRWTERTPLETTIVEDEQRRLIAVYRCSGR